MTKKPKTATDLFEAEEVIETDKEIQREVKELAQRIVAKLK